MSVTLNGRTYSYDDDFANWAHAGIKAGTGLRVFPDAIFTDFLAEVLLQKAGIASINGLAPGSAGNVAISDGANWVRSSTASAAAVFGATATFGGVVTLGSAATVGVFDSGAASYVALRFNQGGVARGFVGADYGQAIVAGSSNGDMVLRTDGASIRFASTTTIIASVGGTGLSMAAGTTIAAQALTATTLATSGAIAAGAGGSVFTDDGSFALIGRRANAAPAFKLDRTGTGAVSSYAILDTAGRWEFSEGITTSVGKVILATASTTGGAGFRLPHGAAPTAPVDGDTWTTTAGMFVRINGVTKTVTLT